MPSSPSALPKSESTRCHLEEACARRVPGLPQGVTPEERNSALNGPLARRPERCAEGQGSAAGTFYCQVRGEKHFTF